MSLIKLPSRFFVDHMERDLDTPVVVKETQTHVWVNLDDPAMAELESDAEYYSDHTGFDRAYFGLCASARATLNAIKKARAEEKGSKDVTA